MTDRPRAERATQRPPSGRAVHRPVARQDGLGYRSLGEWHTRDNNRSIEADTPAREPEAARGYCQRHTSPRRCRSWRRPPTATGITLYPQANLRTYQLLRYGVPVQTAAGQSHEHRCT
jgi:type I restriction enzyme R subunit